MKILLIAGHGAGDPGAVCGAYKEADETRNMVGLLRPILEQRGISVGVYPASRNAYADYKAGTLRATAHAELYDYVLEIHFNACTVDHGDGKTKGVECYVNSSESGIGVENAICDALHGLGFTNRGVKRYDKWAVIKSCKNAGTSSALLEVCFIDDADDMKIYTKSRERVAEAIANGICEGFGIPYKEVPAVAKTDMEIAKELAVAKGIIKGNGSGDMMWDKPMTREQLVTVLYRLGVLK